MSWIQGKEEQDGILMLSPSQQAHVMQHIDELHVRALPARDRRCGVREESREVEETRSGQPQAR